jgi:uncharacterized protein (DUF58 family)
MMQELLTSTLIHRLARHRFQSRNMKRGHHKGTRRSNKLGTSLEFSDFRPYQPGDDLRLIDWNVFARTNKHYIKRFLDEQELIVSIYLDCTKSMASVQDKWAYAKGIAASLGYMSLCADDRVGIFPISSREHAFRYRKGRAFANRLVHYVDMLQPSDYVSTFSESVQQMIQPRSSFSVLITDLMEPPELIELALKKLQGYKQELYVIQLLSKEELIPNYQGDLQLVDSETYENVNVTMSTAVKNSYQQRLRSHTNHIQKFCFERGIHFIQCNTTDSLEDIICNQLVAKGWIQVR